MHKQTHSTHINKCSRYHMLCKYWTWPPAAAVLTLSLHRQSITLPQIPSSQHLSKQLSHTWCQIQQKHCKQPRSLSSHCYTLSFSHLAHCLGCIYSPAEDPHSVLGHSVSLAQRGDVGNEHRCCQFTVISCMRRNWRAASRWHHPKSSSEINTESFAQVEI